MNCLDLFELPLSDFIRQFRAADPQLVVFQHVPKTAGSSIHAALHKLDRGFHWIDGEEAHGWSDFLSGHQVEPFRILRGHLRKQHLDELIERGISFRAFCFLRDPVRQIISHFRFCHSENSQRHQWHRQQHPDLESFIRDYLKPNFTTQFLVGPCQSAEEAIDKLAQRFALVGMTEFFNTGMFVLMKCLGEEYQVKPKRNVSGGSRSNDDLLTERVNEMIDRDYAIDLAVHRFFLQRYGDVAERAVEFMSTKKPGISKTPGL